MITVCCIAFSVLGVNAATLNWKSSQGNPDGYKVYYGTDANNPSHSKDVGNVTQYNIDQLGLPENVQYYFYVTAYNTHGESAPCPPVAYTSGDTTPPVAPIGLNAVAK